MGMQDRLDWSIQMQQSHALRYYRQYWDNITKIDEVDKIGAENDAMKRLDFSGIDKIVYTEKNQIHIAQRFRRMRNMKEGGLKEPDFSIRIKTYGDKATEYQKLKEAWTGLGSTPAVYGFGITPYGRQVAVANGFEKFYLIDVDAFLKKHFDTGEIEIIDKVPNGDGSMGAYFSLDSLEDNNCILRKWPRVDKPTNPENIQNW